MAGTRYAHGRTRLAHGRTRLAHGRMRYAHGRTRRSRIAVTSRFAACPCSLQRPNSQGLCRKLCFSLGCEHSGQRLRPAGQQNQVAGTSRVAQGARTGRPRQARHLAGRVGANSDRRRRRFWRRIERWHSCSAGGGASTGGRKCVSGGSVRAKRMRGASRLERLVPGLHDGARRDTLWKRLLPIQTSEPCE
jgi:hypothetical protein